MLYNSSGKFDINDKLVYHIGIYERGNDRIFIGMKRRMCVVVDSNILIHKATPKSEYHAE
jgi:hypothetical protein